MTWRGHKRAANVAANIAWVIAHLYSEGGEEKEAGYFPFHCFRAFTEIADLTNEKERSPGDNAQEAAGRVLIELPLDSINCGLINGLKMKSNLFV